MTSNDGQINALTSILSAVERCYKIGFSRSGATVDRRSLAEEEMESAKVRRIELFFSKVVGPLRELVGFRSFDRYEIRQETIKRGLLQPSWKTVRTFRGKRESVHDRSFQFRVSHVID